MKRRTHANADIARTLALKDGLAADGWRTPDTYGREYKAVPASAGVYLFLLYTDEFFHKAQVGYVGMSVDIRRRWTGHEILAQMVDAGRWTQRWFKPISAEDLRRTEASYIVKFNPPWNINGRPRGLIQ